MPTEDGYELDAKERNALVRQVFEAGRAVAWAESLQDECQKLQVATSTLEGLRPSFDRHLEKEWPWWQAEAKGYATDRLYRMLVDYGGRADALGVNIGRNGKAAESFNQALTRYADGGAKQVPKDKGKGIER
jgi:hypothetical protein